LRTTSFRPFSSSRPATLDLGGDLGSQRGLGHLPRAFTHTPMIITCHQLDALPVNTFRPG
jgi:hypothetical protein